VTICIGNGVCKTVRLLLFPSPILKVVTISRVKNMVGIDLLAPSSETTETLLMCAMAQGNGGFIFPQPYA